MKKVLNLSKRTTAFLAAILLLVGLSVPVLVPKQTQASQLTSRSLTISSSAIGSISTDVAGNAVAPGAGGNGAKALHTVKFTMASTGATIGSILIMYCTSPIFQSGCTTPGGLTAQNLTSVTVSGQTAGTFTLDTTTPNSGGGSINSNLPANTGACNGATTVRINCVAIKAGTPAAQTGTPTLTIQYGGGASNYITNPDGSDCPGANDNCQFYARVIVFSDASYTTQVDFGGLAASTAQQVDITAKVQEELNFSVGTTYVAPSTTCAAFSDNGALALGDAHGVLSTSTAYTGLSYFRINSNTLHGTTVQYSGDTLKNGLNSITAVGTSPSGVNSAPGTDQFGLALENTANNVNANYSQLNIATAPNHYDYGGTGTLTTRIAPGPTTAAYQFDTGSVTTPVTLASSSGGISCDTGVVQYLGNVSTSTPAGIYTTTITYIATGSY